MYEDYVVNNNNPEKDYFQGSIEALAHRIFYDTPKPESA